MKIKKQYEFRWKMVLSTLCFILAVSGLSLGVVYYWSFYHFSNLFEDRVIDEYTFQRNQDMGVKNEWILGVTTDSIDVVESIHDTKVAKEIEKSAKMQKEPEKLYRTTIDGKHLLYLIKLDVKNGETIYKYSIIKDIYAEIFPQIVLTLLGFVIIISILSVLYLSVVSKELYGSIRQLRGYTRKIAGGRHVEQIDVQTHDSEFRALVGDLESMKDTIEKEASARQSTLQFLSHEMKTPLMIIEGYAASASDGIYPKGDLKASMNTIMVQTERMKQRLQDLLTIVRIDTSPVEEDHRMVQILPCVQEILTLFNAELADKQVSVDLSEEVSVWINPDRLKILLENLISNQVKYSDHEIRIWQEIKEESIQIKFFNDGLPVPLEIKDSIFQPFVKGSAEGSGLGLSICKNIMIQNGGQISLDEKEDGVQFTLTFIQNENIT